MDIYSDELGLKKLINAAGTYTAVGATKMKKQTLEAMVSAADSYVDIEEMQKIIGEKIAIMTHNEAAYVCNSCSAAIYLATAAFVSKKYKKPFKYLSLEDVKKCNIICIWSQHIPYDEAINRLGVQTKFIGYTNPQSELTRTDLKMAIDDNTVGVYYAPRTPCGYYGEKCLNLIDAIEASHECGIPILVDAAAQLPPKSNLWEFTKMGADVVTFSGGKDLCGPQASGLAVGKKEYIEIMRESGFPNYGPGRIMKIGREELAGIYTAVKLYMENDEEKRLKWCEDEIIKLKNAFKESKNYCVERCWPNQAGQPLPRAFVKMTDNKTAEKAREFLMQCDPGVFCFTENKNGIYINPMCLENGDMEYIIKCLVDIENKIYKEK